MKKKDRLFLNTVTPLLFEVVTIVSGFILPRLLLGYFGSEVNGLVQSITQFLGIISFLEMGVGQVVRFNLFQPLVQQDKPQLSRVMVAANRFFRRIALILIGYTVVLMLCYPFFAAENFDHLYTALLILAMSVSFFSQFYFGQVNQLLLTADQKGYIQYASQIATVVANTAATVVLLQLGAGIHLVKLSTSLIFLVRPLFLQFYVRRHYDIDYKIRYTEEPIKQKWNGIAQHVSHIVLEHTDVILLTVFATLKDVSIYSAYFMVVNGVKKLITTAVSGVQAKLGHVIAGGTKQEVDSLFQKTEWVIHFAAVFLFGCVLVLVVPFVLVYTSGITDANYNVPIFAVLITFANAGHSLRLPYSILIQSAGHYRQTQSSYIIATLMNIGVSIVFVFFWGLVGVAIGTLAAMLFQTVWMAWYGYRHILHRKLWRFLKQLLADGVCFGAVFAMGWFIRFQGTSYLDWFLLALPAAGAVFLIVCAVNILFFFPQMKGAAGMVLHKIRRKLQHGS